MTAAQKTQDTQQQNQKKVTPPVNAGVDTAIGQPSIQLSWQRACTEPETVSPREAQQLQQTIGNQAIGELSRTNSSGSSDRIQRQDTPALPSIPDVTLTPPSLLQPPGSRPGFDFGLDLNLQLNPEVQGMMSQIQIQLDIVNLQQALSSLNLGMMPPSGPDLSAPPTPNPEPLVPAGAGPDKVRPATGGDVMRAFLAVPAFNLALMNLQGQILSQLEHGWQDLNTAERVGTVSSLGVIGLSALGGAMAHPESRQWLLNQLNGRILPVPGVDPLQLEFNISGSNLMFGLHFDIGQVLPASWGFGPSDPTAIGGPPQPESSPFDSLQRTVEDTSVLRQDIFFRSAADDRGLQRREENELVQESAFAGAAGGEVETAVEENIQQARGSGQTMPEQIRGSMEQAFGADFSGVKIHTDGQADNLNQSLQARAFTTGRDIFFRQGEFNPGSSNGQELLAHELTHVVQQNGTAVQKEAVPRDDDIVQTKRSDTIQRDGEELMSIDIRHSVNYVAQDTDTDCWSAAAAMLLGGNQLMSPGSAPLNPDGTLPETSVPILAREHGFAIHYPQSWTVQRLADLLQTGPLMVGGRTGSTDSTGRFQPHFIVVGGIFGDGTAENTHLILYDPAFSEDAGYEEKYSDWLNMYPEATEYILHL